MSPLIATEAPKISPSAASPAVGFCCSVQTPPLRTKTYAEPVWLPSQAMAHINVQEKEPQNGIENWEALSAKIRQVRHVTAVAPALYSPIFLSGPTVWGSGRR